jgi:hypothetical protein
MFATGFEPAIPASERPQAHVLARLPASAVCLLDITKCVRTVVFICVSEMSVENLMGKPGDFPYMQQQCQQNAYMCIKMCGLVLTLQ